MMIVVTMLWLIIADITAGPTSSSTPTITTIAPGATPVSGGIDSTILAALIGFAGAILVALIGGGFLLHQIKRNNQQAQELLRLQKELDIQQVREEHKQQRQETEAETARITMQKANTLNERVAAYRKALRVDPRIAVLQILDMPRSIEITDIYIRLRLHQETRSGYDFDPAMPDADTKLDPNALFKTSHLRLEQRTSTSLTPEEALRSYKRCVVLGDPGAGKTTLLKYLALQIIDQHFADLPDLPIHVELNA